ncbi:MAG: hypothetical protein AB8H80_05450 [Planctomycetota bacterium]
MPYALAAAAAILVTAVIAWRVSDSIPTPTEAQARASVPLTAAAPNVKPASPKAAHPKAASPATPERAPRATTSLPQDEFHRVRPTLAAALQTVQQQGLHTRDWTHAMSRLDRNCRDAATLLSHLSHQIRRRPRGISPDEPAQRRAEAEQIVHVTTIEVCARLSAGIQPIAPSRRGNSVVAMPMTFEIAMADAADPTVEPERRAAALLRLERCVTDSLEAMRTTPVVGGRESKLKAFYIGRLQQAVQQLSPL